MAYELERLGPGNSGSGQIEQCLRKLLEVDRPRCRRLWTYYANPMSVRAVDAGDNGSGRPYVQGQEWGLPMRITGGRVPTQFDSARRKEVVIENDIGWRINTTIEYLFGKEVLLESAAGNPERQQLLTGVLRQVIANHGGMLFFQQLALLGLVYGFVDVVVKLDTTRLAEAVPQTVDAPLPPRVMEGGDGGGVGEGGSGDAAASPLPSTDVGSGNHVPPPVDVEKIASLIRLEIVEPGRAMPILSDVDWRTVEAYGQVWEEEVRTEGTGNGRNGDGGFLSRWLRGATRRISGDSKITVMEIISPTAWQRYRDGALVAEGVNSLGEIPLVHIQNATMPFAYAGASDVEPLIPLQDELNTRMSDRANRITLQSFKMYLGKGIDGFLEMPVAPGRMWATDNDQASVIEFGGDNSCPSENSHIADVREAMDKISSVTPIAAGSIKDRIGNLTSAAALRITLMALLSKIDRKRTTYGTGIRRMCELILAWLDVCGALPNVTEERGINLYWSDPLPGDEMESIQEAQAKINLGVAKEVVLKELGY
ncbi:MAG TPA: phage portal protein [Tepidisphaeraceae bacterium]|nr:phage portal protein [Tepidisphaeraceae bacterium]